MTREEILNGLYDIKSWHCNGNSEMYRIITEAIKVLEQDSKWIPVSERLPKPREDVWCNSHIGQIAGYYDEYVETWYASFGQGRDYMELIVNAWMPLPAPFESQESEG